MGINELSRKVYELKKDSYGDSDKLLLFLQQTDGSEPIWSVSTKGWFYTLWYEIGTRGGLAEAKELLVEGKNLTIEEYIKIYKKAFENEVSDISQFFNDFDVELIIDMKTERYPEYAQKRVEKHHFEDLGDNVFRKELNAENQDILHEFSSEAIRIKPKFQVEIPLPIEEQRKPVEFQMALF